MRERREAEERRKAVDMAADKEVDSEAERYTIRAADQPAAAEPRERQSGCRTWRRIFLLPGNRIVRRMPCFLRSPLYWKGGGCATREEIAQEDGLIVTVRSLDKK